MKKIPRVNNGIVDARSKQGILARGKNVYPGGSPNPSGINSSNAIKLLNARKRKAGIR